MAARQFACLRCRVEAAWSPRLRAGMCHPCMQEHHRDGLRASAEVTKAINSGGMKRAREHVCADCGARARDWDHRDYLRPLTVEAVCKPCNLKRPTAFDCVYRPAGEAAPPVFPHTDRRRRGIRQQLVRA